MCNFNKNIQRGLYYYISLLILISYLFVISQNVHDMILLASKDWSFQCPYSSWISIPWLVYYLTMQVDWLKKNLKKFADLTTRVNLVRNLLTTKELPASVGASLLDINRTSIYYKGSPVSDDMNWHVKRSLIISIRIIQPRVQDRCLHN